MLLFVGMTQFPKNLSGVKVFNELFQAISGCPSQAALTPPLHLNRRPAAEAQHEGVGESPASATAPLVDQSESSAGLVMILAIENSVVLGWSDGRLTSADVPIVLQAVQRVTDGRFVVVLQTRAPESASQFHPLVAYFIQSAIRQHIRSRSDTHQAQGNNCVNNYCCKILSHDDNSSRVSDRQFDYCFLAIAAVSQKAREIGALYWPA